MPGYGRFAYDRAARHDLLPGSLMIVSVPGPHVYYLPEDSDHWEFVFLVMTGREAIRITGMIEQNLGSVLSTGTAPGTVALLYEILDKFFSGEIHDPFINSCYTYRLCMTLLKETGNQESTGEIPVFEKLKTFLKDNIHRDISVEEMADFMGLSRSHFIRLFSGKMGMSPRMYWKICASKPQWGCSSVNISASRKPRSSAASMT
jgi:hypothetical protein